MLLPLPKNPGCPGAPGGEGRGARLTPQPPAPGCHACWPKALPEPEPRSRHPGWSHIPLHTYLKEIQALNRAENSPEITVVQTTLGTVYRNSSSRPKNAQNTHTASDAKGAGPPCCFTDRPAGGSSRAGALKRAARPTTSCPHRSKAAGRGFRMWPHNAISGCATFSLESHAPLHVRSPWPSPRGSPSSPSQRRDGRNHRRCFS